MFEIYPIIPSDAENPSKAIKTVDHIPLLEYFQSVGLPTEEFEDLNSFTYGPLPKGSTGKFLVRTSDLVEYGISDGEIFDKHLLKHVEKAVELVIDSGHPSDFQAVHRYLYITHYQHFDIPFTTRVWVNDWNEGVPPLGQQPPPPRSPVPKSRNYVTIVYLSDICYYLDSIITKDYNTPEEDRADHLTFEEIIDEILDDAKGDLEPIGQALDVNYTDLPNSVKPKNVLCAGISIREFLKEVADRHFLVASIDRSTPAPGKLTFVGKNLDVTSPLQIDRRSNGGRLVYNSYGGEVKAEELKIASASTCGNEIGSDSVTVPVYTDNWDKNTAYSNEIKNFEFLYPFYDLDDLTDTSDLSTLLNDISGNYERRTAKLQKTILKGVAQPGVRDPTSNLWFFFPGLTHQKITYKYTKHGMFTILEGEPLKLEELRYVDSYMYRRAQRQKTKILFQITSVTESSLAPEWSGLREADVTVLAAPCCHKDIVGTQVTVYDLSGCVFNLDTNEELSDLNDRKGWAFWGLKKKISDPSKVTECEWIADGLCCPEDPISTFLAPASNSFLEWDGR